MNSFAPSGLYAHSPRYIARRIRDMGFNCVRLQWSLELYHLNPIVRPEVIEGWLKEEARASQTASQQLVWSGVDTDTVAGTNMTALDVMDRVVDGLAAEKVMVILDNHINDARWYVPSERHWERLIWYSDSTFLNM
jgi:endoglucanase